MQFLRFCPMGHTGSNPSGMAQSKLTIRSKLWSALNSYINDFFELDSYAYAKKLVFLLSMTVPAVSPEASERDYLLSAPVSCNTPQSENNTPSCGTDTDVSNTRLSIKNADEYQIAIRSNSCSYHDSPSSYEWANVKDIKGGSDSVATVKTMALQGLIFKQDYNGRRSREEWRYIEALPIRPNQTRYALCKVSRLGGPPQDCATVVSTGSSDDYVRVQKKIYNEGNCPLASSFRSTGSIDIDYKIKTRKNPAIFAKAIVDALSHTQDIKPEMEIHKESDGKILGVSIESAAAIRTSKTLNDGSRESYDFDLGVWKNDEGRSKFVVIRGTLKAMVARRAEGSLVSLNGLNDAQRGKYAAAFDSLVGNAITSVCGIADRSPPKIIECK